MNKRPAISIIMPVYNSKEYLPDTVKSILNQSFEDFELIMVDDGSSDGSGEVCDLFASKDGRIKVIHQKNAGICAARNRGLKEAAGKYIAFSDNDDICHENLLMDNYELAEKYNADVVRFSRINEVIKNGKKVFEEKNVFSGGFFSGDEFIDNFDEISKTGEGVWAGLYSRDFLERYHIVFDESMKYGYEDLYFMTQIYMKKPKTVLNPGVYYRWIMRYSHSTSGKVNINNINSLIKCMLLKRKMFNKYNLDALFSDLWINEVSRRIYTVVRYVSPVKAKIKLKKRISVIKYFRNSAVFKEKLSRNSKKQLYKSSKSAWLVYTLFQMRLYYMLYFMITLKQIITEK